MNYISALAIVLGIVSGGISLYEFLKKGSWRPGVAYSIAAVGLLVAAVVVANLFSPSGGTASGVSSAQSSPTSSSGTGNTPISTPGSPTPTPPTPAPTPTPAGKGCSYTTSTGWSDWQQNLPDGWHVVNGELNGNGNGYQTIPIPDACKMTSPDYIVKARVKAIHASGFSFGIMVRAISSDNGYLAMAHFYAGDARIYVNTPGPNDFPVASGGGVPSDVYVTYTVTVKGNTITLSLTGGSTITATDNTYYMPGDVYLRVGIQFSMQSFSVQPLQ